MVEKNIKNVRYSYVLFLSSIYMMFMFSNLEVLANILGYKFIFVVTTIVWLLGTIGFINLIILILTNKKPLKFFIETIKKDLSHGKEVDI